MLRRLLAKRRTWDERGVVLLIAAVSMVALCGMVALSIDVGQMMLTRRRLQNAADAAAMAGAVRLPGSPSQATTLAQNYVQNNGFSTSNIQSINVTRTSFDNDTITVTTTRTLPMFFAQVLGRNNATITAQARVQLHVVQGVDTDRNGVFPFAIWGGNDFKADGSEVKPGDMKVYYSSNWIRDNVRSILPQCKNKGAGNYDNCNWNIQGNNFKGYFHWKNRFVWIDPNDETEFNDPSQGGVSGGTAPLSELEWFQSRGIPVWMPLVTTATKDGGDLKFTIVNFVCVLLEPFPNGGGDHKATVLDAKTDSRCAKGGGLHNGGQNPKPPLQPVYTYTLTQ